MFPRNFALRLSFTLNIGVLYPVFVAFCRFPDLSPFSGCPLGVAGQNLSFGEDEIDEAKQYVSCTVFLNKPLSAPSGSETGSSTHGRDALLWPECWLSGVPV